MTAIAGVVVETKVVANQAEHLDDIGPVEDAEPGVEAQSLAEETKHTVGHGVERAPPHPTGRGGVGEPTRSGEQLVGGSAAEGQQADALGRDIAPEQRGHPVGQHPRLAATRPRHHQKG